MIQAFLTIFAFTQHFGHFRLTFQWFEDGDSIQAAADQRANDHLPPLLPPAADVLRHHILQTFLL